MPFPAPLSTRGSLPDMRAGTMALSALTSGGRLNLPPARHAGKPPSSIFSVKDSPWGSMSPVIRSFPGWACVSQRRPACQIFDPTSGPPRPGRALTLAVRAPDALPQRGQSPAESRFLFSGLRRFPARCGSFCCRAFSQFAARALHRIRRGARRRRTQDRVQLRARPGHSGFGQRHAECR